MDGHDQLDELDESRCPSCEEPWPNEEESTRPVCRRCDDRLEIEIKAYLAFVAICRA